MSVFTGYDSKAKYSSASFEGKANKEWGNVQLSSGSMYVPDVSITMDPTTLQINLQKIESAIAHYSQSPVPPNLMELYNKEVDKKGQSISKVVAAIIAYLERKKAAYVSQINVVATGDPVAEPAVVPGATTTDEGQSAVDGVDSSKALAEQQQPAQEEEGMSKKKLFIIAGSVAAALIVAAVIIYKKRNK